MPKLGLTMTEGTLTRWLVAEGQAVEQGDVLFEFESEKSTMEFESPAGGVVGRLLVAAGETVPCGTAVAILETSAQGLGASETMEPAATSVNATPAARRRAREMGVDLDQVEGRGPNGRIHVVDVEAWASRIASAPLMASTPAVNSTPVARRLAADLGVDLAQVAGSGPGGRIGRDDVTKAARAGASAPAPAG
jgi:pyruvate dehydrogenase E2 component (dihydrolipoamide acetyltransferase)